MHSYWLYSIGADRTDALRHEAEQRRLAATATRAPRIALAARLHERLTAVLAPVAPQPQPCPC